MDSFGIDPLNMTKIDSASSLSSRQKSCNACVRGKRRCDKRTPRCTRCAAKGLDCVYHKMPPAQSGSGSGGDGNTAHRASSGQSTGGSNTPEMADLPDFDMGFDYESLGTETSPESMCHIPDQAPQQHQQHNHSHHHHHNPSNNNNNSNHLHLGPGLDFDIVDFMNAIPAHTAQTSTLPTPPPTHNPAAALANNSSFFASLFDNTTTDGASKLDIPPVPGAPFMSSALVPQPPKTPVRDISLLRPDAACSGASLHALAVHDPRSWMGYTMRSLTAMHRTFAQTRALPFLHPRLWAAQLPKPILAVFSAATAYANRSDDNRAWIMKLLADTAVAVHREGELAATPQDKLARVQALVILDSMRVFDGDVGLRAAAEREAHVLSAWIGELQQAVTVLEAEAMQHAAAQGSGMDGTDLGGGGGGGAPAYPSRERPPKGWDAWILLESARRTLLFSCAFVCMNKLLKSLDVSQSMWQDLRFTASRHLWEAPSSVEFFRSWRDKPQYFIRDFDFKDFWSYARADDMDEFTKIMLMPQIGMDTLEHFMAGEDLSHVTTV
ncbi:C6 zinc finger domain protein [Akanthomyces lecanii RCEF 1005]|uniref:C6 zinc finger domain protein n=1 Tax=Akanthomyces lecanii RCEF 1005 TaxID=1081108 RepID=A0A168INZ4_CORDF|nr:C6 zinc finger domain protein [Akanthomyces lecanii RCEF 1005]